MPSRTREGIPYTEDALHQAHVALHVILAVYLMYNCENISDMQISSLREMLHDEISTGASERSFYHKSRIHKDEHSCEQPENAWPCFLSQKSFYYIPCSGRVSLRYECGYDSSGAKEFGTFYCT
mmetsp:Transcript_37286/g.60615  ORF Transcript_37286/g.60615 Transcript_37286/m.60615 type:complete len:124 (-) Transcript_37286:266-637(-)